MLSTNLSVRSPAHPQLLANLCFVHPRNQSPVIPIQDGTPEGRYLYHAEMRNVPSREGTIPHLFLMMSAVPKDIPRIVEITREMWTNRYRQLEINAVSETYEARLASHPHAIIAQYAIPLAQIGPGVLSYIEQPAGEPFNDLEALERNLFLKPFLEQDAIACKPSFLTSDLASHLVGAISVIRKNMNEVCADPQSSWNHMSGNGKFGTNNPHGRIAVCPEVSALFPGTGWAIIQNGVAPMAGYLGLDGALPYSVCRDLGHVIEAICRTMTGIPSRISGSDDGAIRIGGYGVLEFGDQGDITLVIQNPPAPRRRDVESGNRMILLDTKRFYLPKAVKKKVQKWAREENPNAILRLFLTSSDRHFARIARREFKSSTPVIQSRAQLKKILQDILMVRIQPGLEIYADPESGRVCAGIPKQKGVRELLGHFVLTPDARIVFEFDRSLAADQLTRHQPGDRHFLLNVVNYLSCQTFDRVIGFHQNNGARLMRIVIGGRADPENSDIVNSLGISPLLFYSIPRPLRGSYPGTITTIPWIPATPPVVYAVPTPHQ